MAWRDSAGAREPQPDLRPAGGLDGRAGGSSPGATGEVVLKEGSGAGQQSGAAAAPDRQDDVDASGRRQGEAACGLLCRAEEKLSSHR